MTPGLITPSLVTPSPMTPEGRSPQPGNGMGLDDQVYNRLLRERIIFLGSVVEDSNANAICAQLLLLAADDPERDIWLYINSPGGSVSAVVSSRSASRTTGRPDASTTFAASSTNASALPRTTSLTSTGT